MKRILTLILIAGWALTTYSQKVIQLEETKLNFDPTSEIVFEDYENGIVKVKEKFATQFQANAIGFLKENFDVLRFLESQDGISGDVTVTATSAKGFITATFNEDGDIVKNYQRFKDVALPYAIRNEVYASYQGWSITKNKYVASGLRNQIDKQKYLIKLERGKEKARMKISPSSSILRVASIE